MRRLLGFLLALVLCVLVQAAGLALWPGFGLVMDTFLLLALLRAASSRPVPACAYGAVAGWAADALAGTPLGLYGITYTLVAFAVSMAAQRLVLNQGPALFAACAAGAAVQQLVLWPLASAFAAGAQAPGIGWGVVKSLSVAAAATLIGGLARRLQRRTAERRLARSSRLRFD
ncbi:MAG: rod shape-determining protein MreD [Thermoanaerobaculia bacterium]